MRTGGGTLNSVVLSLWGALSTAAGFFMSLK